MSRIIPDSGSNATANVGKTEHLWISALSVGAIGAAFWLNSDEAGRLFFTLPFPHLQITIPEVCAFKQLLQIPCPGCGLTHSFTAAARGDFIQAFGTNGMGPFLFLLFLVQIPYRIIAFCRPRIIEHGSIRLCRTLVVWFVIVGLLINWIYNVWQKFCPLFFDTGFAQMP